MTIFQYHPDILTTFPALVGGVLLADGVQNGATPPVLAHQYAQEQQAAIGRIGATPLSELPTLSAWRGAFRKFNVDPTQYRSAAEALLRRLTKKGDIPSINTLVDIGNLVSIRYALPVAIIDRSALQGTLTVHFADGSETFTVLNQAEVEHPEPGEVVFSDEARRVHARRWCWRQSDESAARETTTDILVTIEAHHANADADVRAALDDLAALLRDHTGATPTTAVLGTGNPAV
jgi:DNA/RNA-binding domain of Phe-tRNA-synthetase-like protein